MNLKGSGAPGAGDAVDGASAREVLRLRPGLSVCPGGAEDPATTWVRINSRVLRLRGESARRILAAIDGTRTLEEVASEVGATSLADVAAAIDRLQRFGLLEPRRCDASPLLAPQVRALTDLGADGAAVAVELAAGRVPVIGDGLLGRAVQVALERAGVGDAPLLAPPRHAGDGGLPAEWNSADMLVVALDSADPDALARLNAHALRLDVPWILLEVHGFGLRAGPFFLPHQTACWACYERRLRANEPAFEERRAAQEALRRAGTRPVPADDLAPGTAAVGAEICALEVVRFFASRVSELTPELHGAFADYSLLAHRASTHRILRLPRCPACGARASGRPTVRAWMEPYDYRESGTV